MERRQGSVDPEPIGHVVARRPLRDARHDPEDASTGRLEQEREPVERGVAARRKTRGL